MSLTPDQIQSLIDYRHAGETWKSMAKKFKGHTPNALRKAYYRNVGKPKIKVLFLDIETAPVLAYVWGVGKQYVSHKMILHPTTMLSWAAKWLGDDKIYYEDVSGQKDLRDDKKIVSNLWKLLDEADVVVGHNVEWFDVKKTNSRIILNDLKPPSSFRTIDTYKIASSKFAFDNNKLVSLAKFLKVPHQKYAHAEFAGEELWVECLAGNPKAWKEMQKYNPLDVLVLEDVYHRLIPWDKKINFNVFHDSLEAVCSCGSKEFDQPQNSYIHTNTGKFHKMICKKCGKEHKGTQNLLSPDKRKAMPR